MTEAEYLAQKADLEAQLAALDEAYTIDGKYPAYPRVLYHETQGSQTVASEAEAKALGAGWSPSPGGGAKAAAPARDEPPPKRK